MAVPRWCRRTRTSTAGLVAKQSGQVKDERGLAPDHEFLIPGEGPCDYVTILKTLERVGYDHYVEVEISFMVQRRPGYDPLAAAEQSYRVLARAFEAAGLERRR